MSSAKNAQNLRNKYFPAPSTILQIMLPLCLSPAFTEYASYQMAFLQKVETAMKTETLVSLAVA
jgi:hypothetical protein